MRIVSNAYKTLNALLTGHRRLLNSLSQGMPGSQMKYFKRTCAIAASFQSNSPTIPPKKNYGRSCAMYF